MEINIKQNLLLEHLISYAFIPTLVLTGYCGLLGIVLNHFNLVGVNQMFVFRMIKLLIYVLPCEFGLILSIIIMNLLNKRKVIISWPNKQGKVVHYLFLLVLPITPVIQYIVNNIEILTVLDSLIIVLFFLIFSGLLSICIPYLLAKIGNIRMLIALGLAFTFIIILMPYLSQSFNWFQSGNLTIQLSFFLGTFILIFLMIGNRFKKIFFIFLIINFIINTAYQFFSKNSQFETEDKISQLMDDELLSRISEKTPESTPDIFFLVYEAYVSNETLMAYGFNNHDQESFLQDLGFKIYPNIYSVGSPTVNSLSRVFNISSSLLSNQRQGIAGDGVVQNVFKDLDYTLFGYVTSSWIYRGYGSKYDFSYPNAKTFDSYSTLISAILIGEFQSDLFFNETLYDEFVQEKRSVFENSFINHTFAYIHSGFPGHSQVSGSCRSDEIDLYIKRIEIANREMQEDIEILIKTHPDSIIIIAGDHGPYITNSCFGLAREIDISEISRLDIQDRFSTFLAIRWPTDDYEDFDNIVVLQDLFPAVFAYLFNDKSILEAKIEPNIMDTHVISGATVMDGIIYGGVDDGQPLYDPSE